MSDYADSLRQQARWIREALDPKTPNAERIELQDVDTDELDAAAAELERLEAAVRAPSIFDAPESWKMSEPEKVVSLIRSVGLWRLGNWDGCCCSYFSIRNVEVDISCGKGRDQGVWISSRSMDYGTTGDGDPELLRPIMNEVVRQLEKRSGRGGKFAEHFHPWKNPQSVNRSKT